MNNKLSILEERVSALEAENNDTSIEMEELEYKIIESEAISIGSLSISAKGSMRRWREFGTGGSMPFSNWDVTVTILDSNGNPTVCDWIKMTNCSHTTNRDRTVAERNSINFFAPRTKGWNAISFDIQIKNGGNIYNTVNIRLHY